MIIFVYNKGGGRTIIMDGQHFIFFFRGTGDFSIYYGAGNNYRGDGQSKYIPLI